MGSKVTRKEFMAGIGSAAGLFLLAGCGGTVGQSNAEKAEKSNNKRYRIGMVPKFTSDPYFVAVNKGAQEAAKELKLNVTFNGPVDADVSKQADIIDQFVQQKYDAITVSANDPDALAPAMKRAKDSGVKTSTFDADVKPDARQVFLNQATFEAMGRTMVDMMVDQTKPEGEFLIVTAVLTAPNQNRWIEEMRKYAKEKYPKMKLGPVLPSNEDLAQARRVTTDYLQSHPGTKGVFCVTGIATPGAAEAVQQLGLKGKVVVTGLGVPSLVREYIKNGTIQQCCLWNPVDIGYGAIYMAHAQLDGTLDSASGFLEAGRLGKLKFIAKDEILLGPPLVFTKKNIDDYSF